MKRKLKMDDLAVASFSTEEGFGRERGTVRGASGETLAEPYESCVVAQTCVSPCSGVQTRDTCYHSCGISCNNDRSCFDTCLRDTC
jgi:hypothetical protein